MDIPRPEGELQKNLFYLGISLLIIFAFMGLKNLTTPEEAIKVGYTEIETECVGLEAGVCIGFQKQDHTTYNYNNYTDPEKGTDNYFREIESELMIRAYDVCNSSMEGYEWTSKVSYNNKTAEEWRQNENIQLLPCEETFYRSLNATS